MDSIGFIILRHVNSHRTNAYWIKCYDCIRKYYADNEIVIIDDSSDYEYITEKKLYKTTIVDSEYNKRGELLPYYYYSRTKFFDIAVIIHDSVFINCYIDFNVNTYKMLWEFSPIYCRHDYDAELRMINEFDDPILNIFYMKRKWRGCFGCMTVIKYDFLHSINKMYDFAKLIPFIKTRYDRQTFERVLACMLQCNDESTTILGNIIDYCKWGIGIEKMNELSSLPIIKIWTGR